MQTTLSTIDMTLPPERTRSVIQTEKFLLNLTDPKVTPGLPKVIRQEARALLRHYPTPFDLKLVADGWNNKVLSFTCECPFGEPK